MAAGSVMAEVVVALISSGYWSPFPATEQEWHAFDATVGEALRLHGTRGLIDLYREEDRDAYEREYGMGHGRVGHRMPSLRYALRYAVTRSAPARCADRSSPALSSAAAASSRIG